MFVKEDKINSLEKSRDVLFSLFGEFFPPLPLDSLDLVFLYVCFIHLSLLQHPVQRDRNISFNLLSSIYLYLTT